MVDEETAALEDVTAAAAAELEDVTAAAAAELEEVVASAATTEVLDEAAVAAVVAAAVVAAEPVAEVCMLSVFRVLDCFSIVGVDLRLCCCHQRTCPGRSGPPSWPRGRHSQWAK